MIARTWFGTSRPDSGDAYLAHLDPSCFRRSVKSTGIEVPTFCATGMRFKS